MTATGASDIAGTGLLASRTPNYGRPSRRSGRVDTMINRLSHAEIAVTDVARAKAFYCDVLGLLTYEESDSAVWLRAPDEFDSWSLKLTLDREPGLLAFGFRVDQEDALDGLAELHRSLRLPQRWLPPGTEPGRGRTLRVRSVGGHVVEFQHAIEEVQLRDRSGVKLPTRQAHLRRGVGPARIDHVNLRVSDVHVALAYWQDALHFAVSELQLDRDGKSQRVWLRRAPFSHDVAIALDVKPGFHHVAYAMAEPAAVVHAADVLTDAGWPVVEYGPGRHGVTDAHFLYIRDPDGNRIELYAGDYVRDLDRPPVVWSHDEYESRGLLWWGQQAPESFLLAGPVLERGLVEAGGDAGTGVAGDGRPQDQTAAEKEESYR